MMPLSRDDVLSVLSYNLDAGEFCWRLDRRGSARAGDIAGCQHPDGYLTITVLMREFQAHRLAWFVMTGEWPPKDYGIGHADGNRFNNSWSNLKLLRRVKPSDHPRDVFTYDPTTGIVEWRPGLMMNGRFADGEAGWLGGEGYRLVSFAGRTIQTHRIAWIIMTGEEVPAGKEIDHINGGRADNRWSNLRLVDRTQNNMNAALRSDNWSGTKGVGFDAARARWTAEIKVNGRKIFLGRFDDKADAVAARLDAERRHFGEFARPCEAS